MVLAVQEAAVVICFMTPKYQDYPACKNELQYATVLRKPVIPCLLTPDWQQSDRLGFITAGLIWLDFRDLSEDNLENKLQRMIEFIHILSNDAFKADSQKPECRKNNFTRTKDNSHGFNWSSRFWYIERDIALENEVNSLLCFTGKSSLGNTILGEKQFDVSVPCYSTIGDKCKVGFRYLHQQ
ncbi:unnamed protein product [Rotaria socialis]|nr:unnamed protein product [Rotaria socialis]CAF3341673.1 unnamed protein product [Rotaria socialis]CAF3678818.1 unnamed protein product [Rotaria socialis]CAF4257353.1 unnamed protein product [Rotaria socialis]CAF4400502.1 unnamed protein product [Rotaria socialis]